MKEKECLGHKVSMRSMIKGIKVSNDFTMEFKEIETSTIKASSSKEMSQCMMLIDLINRNRVIL